MPSPYQLVVALLTVRSSYLENTEEPHEGVPDTVQFWFTPDDDWRVKTFAIDHDIHVYRIRSKGSDRKVDSEFAVANIHKNYGDVVDRIAVVDIDNPADEAAVAVALGQAQLQGRLERGGSGVAFCNPDGGKYSTKSQAD